LQADSPAVGTGNTSATSKKALEIAKAHKTAHHQTDIDKELGELKRQNPVCGDHKMSCWTGHSSGIHVQLTEMRFRAWATEIVRINFRLCVNLAISDTYIFKMKQREWPGLECTVTYEHPPQNHMFDIPPLGRSCSSGTSLNSTPTPELPNGVAPIIINMPDFMGGYTKRHSPLPSSDLVDYFNKPWPSLVELLTHALISTIKTSPPMSHV